MIEARIEEYCHDCPDFEVDVRSIVRRYDDDTIAKCNHIIYCKHRNKCEAIKKHLEKENKNDT